MKKIKKLILVLVIMLFVSCGTTKQLVYKVSGSTVIGTWVEK